MRSKSFACSPTCRFKVKPLLQIFPRGPGRTARQTGGPEVGAVAPAGNRGGASECVDPGADGGVHPAPAQGRRMEQLFRIKASVLPVIEAACQACRAASTSSAVGFTVAWCRGKGGHSAEDAKTVFQEAVGRASQPCARRSSVRRSAPSSLANRSARKTRQGQ